MAGVAGPPHGANPRAPVTCRVRWSQVAPWSGGVGIGAITNASDVKLIMSPAEERLAEALAIERMYGEGASLWIAGRIEALSKAGDTAGVERFRAIAYHLDRLRGSGSNMLS